MNELMVKLRGSQPTDPELTAEQRALIEKLRGSTQAGINQINQAADEIEAQPEELDVSPLLALADKWSAGGKGNLAASYQRPPSKEERALTVAKLRALAGGEEQKATDSVLRELLGRDKMEEMMTRFLLSQGGKEDRMGLLQQKELNKMTQAFGSDLDPYQKARGAFAKIADLGVRAARAKTLLNQVKTKPGGATPQELSEVAASVASMITNQNVVAQEQIEAILPKGVAKDAAALKSYLLSEPVGANMQKFLDRLEGTIDREVQTADKQSRTLRQRAAAKHRTLFEMAPDRMFQIASQYGIQPEELTAIFTTDPKELAKQYTTEMPVATEAEVELKRPEQVTPGDWDKLSEKQKKDFVEHFSKK